MGREIWIFVSFACSIGMAYGSYRAMQDDGASFQDLSDSFSSGGGGGGGGTPAAPAPEQPRTGSTPPPPPPPPPPTGGPGA